MFLQNPNKVLLLVSFCFCKATLDIKSKNMELEEVLLDLTGFPPHVKTTKISKKMKDLF